MEQEIRNPGGVNGLGEGLINTNSRDFLALQSMIQQISSDMSEEERLKNECLSIRFQMESYLNDARAQITHAGYFIEQFLKAIKVKKKDFAKYIGYEESNLSALLKGRRKINPDLALKFGHIFKINPLIWLSIENKNELIKALEQNKENYQAYKLKDLMRKAG
ncbi:MAG: hypothetical protein D6730_08925 [Bacteroidetes bacterium]|nr:MAG: hypothetical protein D6730_08925 [Bacteroidota bacterium]